MNLRLDHATIAGRDLDRLTRAFDSVGLTPEYGGMHSNGVTHMAQLGFPDNTYIELVSTAESGVTSPLWDGHIQQNGGPCAWAIAVDDIEDAIDHLRTAGISVDGPEPMARERPDGVSLSWKLAFPGDGPPGSTFPFLIADETPRTRRVAPTPDVVGSELTGIDRVVVVVHDLDSEVERFQQAFGCSPKTIAPHPAFEAQIARFREAPVAIAEPLDDSWLTPRLETFGPSPCAILLETSAFDASIERFDLVETTPLDGRPLGWRGSDDAGLPRVGVIDNKE